MRCDDSTEPKFLDVLLNLFVVKRSLERVVRKVIADVSNEIQLLEVRVFY